MKGHLVFAAVLALTLGGCALQPTPTAAHRAGVEGNAQEFDSYVTRRTDDLIRMGATKDRSLAEAQAVIDANRRYGSRVADDPNSWTWTTARNRDLSRAELDTALAKAAQDGTQH